MPAGTGGASGLADAVLAVVAEKTGYPVEMLDVSLQLETDLGIDSIKRVEILSALRRRVPGLPDVDAAELGTLRSLGEIVDRLDGVPSSSQTSLQVRPVDDDVGDRPGADLGAAAGNAAGDAGDAAGDAGDGVLRREVRLSPLPPVDVLVDCWAAHPVALLVDRGGPDGTALEERLTAAGWTVHRHRRPAGAEADRGQAGTVGGLRRLDLCVHLLTAVDWDDAVAELAGAVRLAGRVRDLLARTAATGTRAAYATLTRIDGGLGHHGTAAEPTALLGGVGGLVKTLAQEAPELHCRAVDVDPDLPSDAVAELLLTELTDAAVVGEVALATDRTRHAVTLGAAAGAPNARPDLTADAAVVAAGAPDAGPGLTADDVLVVSGGARGVTAACVRALAERTTARFLLLGRTVPADEPGWAAGVPEDGLRAAVIGHAGGRPHPREVERAYRELLAGREIRATLAALGDRATYLSVDVTDGAAVAAALAPYAPTAIVHGAGVLADALLPAKTAAGVGRVLAPKLTGLRALLDAVPAARHVLLFGSVAGLYGNPGQADYAVANEALARLARTWRAADPRRHVTAVAWAAWDGGMVTPALRARFAERGVPLLAPAAGARAFADQFTPARAADTYVLIEPAAPTPPAGPAGPADRPRRAFTARRSLAGLAASAVLDAHRIGRSPVLPATVALGLMIDVVERAHPGLRVGGARDVQVHKGIVLDGSEPAELLVTVRPEADDLRVTVTADRGGRIPVPHYAATLTLTTDPAAPAAPPGATPAARPEDAGPRDAAPRDTGPRDAAPRDAGPRDAGPGAGGTEVYRDGTLFHGPVLQGIRRELAADPLTLECALPDTPLAAGAYAGAAWSPVLGDVLLHGPTVLARRLLGRACLPLSIGRLELPAPLPDGTPFTVTVHDVRTDPDGLTASVTAADPAGRVLHRLYDVRVVATPGMADRFAEAVRARTGTAEDAFRPPARSTVDVDGSGLIVAVPELTVRTGTLRLRATVRTTDPDWLERATTEAARLLATAAGLAGLRTAAQLDRDGPAAVHRTGTPDGDAELLVEATAVDLVPEPWLRVDAGSAYGTVKDLTVVVRGGDPGLPNQFHLTHCARGSLATAFGPDWARFDGRKAARLPSYGLQLVDRVVVAPHEVPGGAEHESEYDSPADAWYYAATPTASAPNLVLLETALQSALIPGWYLGSTRPPPDAAELSLRNLDGHATVLREVDLRDRTVRQRTLLTSTVSVPGTILQRFDFELATGGEPFYRGQTLFGHFRSLDAQVGLDSGRYVPPWLDGRAGRELAVGRATGQGHLALLDAVTVVDGGGRHGRGYLHATRPIEPDAWYLARHFHLDPVIPGSIGIETVLHALQAWLLDSGHAAGLRDPEFVLPVGARLDWRYRGQFLGTDASVTLEAHVRDVARSPGRVRAYADASVWKPGLRIYELTGLAVELRERDAPPWGAR